MSEPARPHPGADMEGFVRDQMAFVGLADAEIETIRRTAPLVLKHGEAITAALYDQSVDDIKAIIGHAAPRPSVFPQGLPGAFPWHSDRSRRRTRPPG